MPEVTPVAAIGVTHEYKTQIRESHLDTFGHVNNAMYLVLFEEARWQLLTDKGFGLKEVQTKQIGPVIMELKIQFRRELKNREHIKIQTFITSDKGKITTLRQIIVNEKGEEACITDMVFGLFDMKARKLIEPTPEWRAALGI